MFKPEPQIETFKVSFMDTTSVLSAWSRHSIEIEGSEWPSVEHYVQAMKFSNADYREKIRTAPHPRQAKNLGSSIWRAKKPNWKSEREVYMTRGIYIKCKTHPEVFDALMSSADLPILDTTNFDYFWGCGRDGRGQNRFGKVLTNVRQKLKAEAKPD